ncbi:MAG TPA: SH3 domain-containing protein [Roseiflexaceae bacterium]|nr:SH3 domain-containing protein [Roseiflexaceae bacterium]
MRKVPIWAWVALLAVFGLYFGLKSPARPTSTPAAPPRLATITGYDPASQSDISPINVWDDYQTRSRVVGQVRTGDRVRVVGRSGDGVQIELNDGTRGWVSAAFLKE